MYNRYIPGANGHTRIAVEEDATRHQRTGEQETRQKQTQSRQKNGERNTQGPRIPQDILRNLAGTLNSFGAEDKNAGMAGILKSLHLEDLDSGDILLFLIVLLLLLEGDNMELVITLGLMLLLGLGEEKKGGQKE